MKTRWSAYTLMLTAPLVLILVLSSCSNKVSHTVDEMKKLEPPSYEGQPVSQQRIDELRQAVKKYQGIVEQKVDAAQQLGDYYKLLGKAYLDNEIFGYALDAFSNAIQVTPTNPILFYYAGVAAANQAKADVGNTESQQQMFRQAAEYYQRATELDPSYTQAYYGLAVLDVFELDEPASAIPLLDKVLGLQKSDTDAMFLLARAYVSTGKTELAADMYDRISKTATSEAIRQQAIDNRRQLLGGAANG